LSVAGIAAECARVALSARALMIARKCIVESGCSGVVGFGVMRWFV